MYPVTVIVGKHLGETGFQLFGGLLGADGLAAARMGIDLGMSSPSVNIEISVSELTFDVAEAFIRLPSSNDSTITPCVDCATYL